MSDPLAGYSQAQIREAVRAIYGSSEGGPETSIGSDGLVHYEIGTGAGYPLDWDAGATAALEGDKPFHVDASNKLLDAINAEVDAGQVDRSTDAIRLDDSFAHVANRSATMIIPTTRTVRHSGGIGSFEKLPEDALTATEAVKRWLENNAGRSESNQSQPSETIDGWEPDPADQGDQTGSGIPTSDDSWREVSPSETPTPGESASGGQSSGGGGLPVGIVGVAIVVLAAGALALRD